MRILATVLVAALAASLSAQTKESVVVQVIEVPVTVTGSDGKAVRGLTQENFQLFDEGKRVPIEYFEVLEMKALATTAATKRPPAAAVRNFLLLFDLANSSPGAIRRAGDAAKEFVKTQLGPFDLAAVATFTSEQGLRMITSFTADTKMLEAAIATLGDPQYFKVADPLMISFKEVSRLTDAVMAADAAATPNAKARLEAKAEIEMMKEAIIDPSTANKVRQQSQDAEQRNRLRIQLSNMGHIARMLDRLHGRKQVILLSEGFDHRLVQGQETKTDPKRQEEDQKRILGEVWNVDNDQRFGSASASRDVSDMVELFRRSDVVLHAIDIKGLRGNVDPSAAEVGSAGGRSNESLFLITRPTGGTVFQNSNDFAATFARMLAQQEVVYLLGFTAKSGTNPGAFRDLSVKTDVRGARVSHRAGYYEPSRAATNIEKTLGTAEILLTDAPVRQLDVSIAATAVPGSEGKARVPVMIEIPGSKMLEGLTGSGATANVFIYAFDAQNRVHDYITQRISLDLTEAGQALRATGLRYYGTLLLPPGDYAIKTVARVEDSDRAGFARTDLRVPAFDGGALSPPLFIARPDDWLTLIGPKRGDDSADPFAVAGTTYVPRSRPMLQASGEYNVVLLAWAMALEGLDLVPVIVRPDGTTAPATVTIAGRTAPDEWGDAKLLLAFKPQGLGPGRYELRLGVKDVQYSLPFAVE